jgi:protein TonB
MRKIKNFTILLGIIALLEINTQNRAFAQTDDVVYSLVDEQPNYPGGLPALFAYIKSDMKYPKEAVEKGTQGRVFVEYVVEKNGIISNIKILKGIGSGCDEEAKRLFAASIKWSPGKLKGEAVRVKMALPIQFKLPQ